MIVGVLTTCHTLYTWDRSIYIFLFHRTTLQVFVTYLIGDLYVHPLWFYKHQHDNRFRSKLFVVCQRWWFQWRFCTYKAPIRYVTKTWSVVLLKRYIRGSVYSYLKCIVYDKLLKPRQSFRITLYLWLGCFRSEQVSHLCYEFLDDMVSISSSSLSSSRIDHVSCSSSRDDPTL